MGVRLIDVDASGVSDGWLGFDWDGSSDETR
jgi:hypothetical protein